MYKLVISGMLLLCFSQASASDFRGADFGDLCGDEKSFEEEAGSKLVMESPNTGNAYEGKHFDHDAYIYYECAGEAGVTRGLAHYQLSSYEEVISFYPAIKSQLIAEYGKPVSEDDHELATKQTHSAYWLTATAKIILSGNFPNLKYNSSVGITYLPINRP